MFGASYHADYATVLAASDDIRAVCIAASDSFCEEQRHPDAQRWDVVDLRRLREADPVLPLLQAALESAGRGEAWRVSREQEDVCPVVTVRGATWDEYLATLDKTARHEIRRKMRRAAAIGELSIEISPPTPDAIDDFIRLHNLRFGESGLFPDNEGGARSRRFVERLAELELAEGDHGILHVARVRCGEHLVFVMVAFDDGQTCYLYNAGLDPEAKNTSPGVTGAGLYIKDRIEAGRRRFDYLRGEERYKYEWGAVDEPIYRLLVTRTAGSAA
jgi:CelD/BcsL family acetyltransferase involved in cellulose biosynthesis